MGFPCARRFETVVVEWVGDEAVVYARVSDDEMYYHQFGGGAYEVWQLADGRRSAADLAELVYGERSGAGLGRAELAIEQLGEAGLLEDGDGGAPSFVSRRRVTKLVVAGLIGVIGLPVVRSITVPDAAAAGSCTGTRPPSQGCSDGEGPLCTTCCCCATQQGAPGFCAYDADVCEAHQDYQCI